MREILFRGFHPCNVGVTETIISDVWYLDDNGKPAVRKQEFIGKWVEGGFFFHYGRKSDPHIVTVTPCPGHASPVENVYYVVPETVGQLTGLLDKNGKRIFEGDILRMWSSTGKNGKPCNEYRCPLPVSYCELWSQFVVEDKDEKEQFGVWQTFEAFEAVGTIYDKEANA